MTSVLDNNKDYNTIMRANDLLPELEKDILILHRLVVDVWGPRLPELVTLVRNPMDYIHIVKKLGNDLVQNDLNLPPAIEMVVSMLISTASSQKITQNEWEKVLEACSKAIELDESKQKILAYIETQMTEQCSNLSTLVGPAVAAKLVGAAGGLLALCKIPACDIVVLGHKKDYNAGLSNLSVSRNQGFIYECEYVRNAPKEHKRRAARLISAKAALCCRMDLGKKRNYGEVCLEQLTKHMERLTQPSSSRAIKPLPIPDDGPKKRRGGRRARKMKKQFAPTEMYKAANRVGFNIPEEEILGIDQTKGLGMLK